MLFMETSVNVTSTETLMNYPNYLEDSEKVLREYIEELEAQKEDKQQYLKTLQIELKQTKYETNNDDMSSITFDQTSIHLKSSEDPSSMILQKMFSDEDQIEE